MGKMNLQVVIGKFFPITKNFPCGVYPNGSFELSLAGCDIIFSPVTSRNPKAEKIFHSAAGCALRCPPDIIARCFLWVSWSLSALVSWLPGNHFSKR
jgi:hypothetical protein